MNTANDDQLKVIAAIWEVFQPSGKWPVVDSIDRLVDERWGLDTYAILRSLPESLVQFDRQVLREDTAVRLRVRRCAGSDRAGLRANA